MMTRIPGGLAKSVLSFAIVFCSFGFANAVSGAEKKTCALRPIQANSEAAAYGKLAPDFTLKTVDGSFSMKDEWNGCDVYVFFKTFTVPAANPLKGLSDLTNTMWKSKFDYLIQYSPRNTHYFFLSQNADPAQRLVDQAIVLGHLNEALATLPVSEQVYWKSRIHIADDDFSSGSSAWLANIGIESFVIDRSQKIRALGVGVYSPLLADGDFLKLATEASYYQFEKDREISLSAARNVTVVPAFKAEVVQAGWAAFGGKINEVEFPSANDMANFDKMELDLELSCDRAACVYAEGNYYYDRIIEVYLCRDAEDQDCDIELGRWITPFGLGGRWVHDVSPLLALVKNGGKQRLRFHTVDRYNVSLNVRLSQTSSTAPKPFAYKELFRGGKLNPALNLRDPLTFEIPEGTKKVELVTTTSGHGWGRDNENCAEFCVTDHEWKINDTVSYVNTLETAGDTFACFLSTGTGVIPNQPGTWYYGRAGWCPGLEVQPKVWDISANVKAGERNKIRYKALFKGGDYVPTVNPEGAATGYEAEINLRSYLVFSK